MYCLCILCLLNIYIIHFTLEHIFYINFVYEFVVKCEICYYILHFYVDIFYILLYNAVMAVNVTEAHNLVFLQCMVCRRIIYGFIK